jgi:hypothetical protein
LLIVFAFAGDSTTRTFMKAQALKLAETTGMDGGGGELLGAAAGRLSG